MAKAARTDMQTSRKAGLASTAKKMDSTRGGFGSEPPARKVAGASASKSRAANRKPGTATRKAGAASALGKMKTTARRAGGR